MIFTARLQRRINWLLILIIGVALSGWSGCASIAGDDRQEPANLTISAAASLKDALEEIRDRYQSKTSGVLINFNFGGSGSLQRQIEQGAPVDLFIPAALRQMEALDDANLIIRDTRVNLLLNRVVLIVPRSATTVKDFDDLVGNRIRNVALGEPESVPAGKYAREIMIKMKIWNRVQHKAVFAKDVRQVLAWVASANADAGIVYLTDAKLTPDVKIVAIAPGNVHSPVIYPLAVVRGTRTEAAARNFAAYLAGSEAQAIFRKYGFDTAEKIKP